MKGVVDHVQLRGARASLPKLYSSFAPLYYFGLIYYLSPSSC